MSGIVEGTGSEKLKNHVNAIENTVKNLEDNFKESNSNDSQIMMSLQTERIKYQCLSHQLEEALKENKQLMTILQERTGEHDSSRRNSQVDVRSSCSTISIVHLQYKYEELLANQHGLLKLLEIKSDEIRSLREENSTLREEMEQLKQNFAKMSEKLKVANSRMLRMKERKDAKICNLKTQKKTLQIEHNRLVKVLQEQCVERDNFLQNEVKICVESEKAQLLQEARKNNVLTYENFCLRQKVERLKSALRIEKQREKSSSIKTAR